MNVQELTQQLDRIEEKLDALAVQQVQKEYYTTAEAAQILEWSEFTVREWCRAGRVRAEKRACGRGRSKEWKISHEELERIQNEGLLPAKR